LIETVVLWLLPDSPDAPVDEDPPPPPELPLPVAVSKPDFTVLSDLVIAKRPNIERLGVEVSDMHAAVVGGIPAAPRTDPYVRNYRIRLLPWVRDAKRSSGYGCAFLGLGM